MDNFENIDSTIKSKKNKKYLNKNRLLGVSIVHENT